MEGKKHRHNTHSGCDSYNHRRMGIPYFFLKDSSPQNQKSIFFLLRYRDTFEKFNSNVSTIATILTTINYFLSVRMGMEKGLKARFP